MVDTIQIFKRAKLLDDWDSHLGCIIIRMLDTYASSGHYPYAKGARLYSQMMLEYEKDPKFNDTIANYKDCGEHVVRYTDHEWSGIWTDLCIEQTYMRSSKSQGGPDRGRMKNSESGHRLWLETLNHMININQVLESNTDEVDTEDKHDSHKDLGASRRKRDSEAIVIIGQWFDLRNPFDNCRDPKLLVSFATGYVSNEETDLINPERFMTVGQSMNKTLDNKPFCTSMEVKTMSPLMSKKCSCCE